MSGLDLGAAFNSAADWVCGSPLVNGVVSNPVYTALLITALVAVVAMGLYGPQVKAAGLKRGIRAAIYVFLLVGAVAFVHHYAVMRLARSHAGAQGVRDVFSGIQQSRESGIGGGTPVVPAGWGAPPAAGYSGGGGYGGGAPAAARPGPRPDNVALAGDVFIEDVVVPSAGGAFGAR